MTAKVECDRCGSQAIWPSYVDGSPFAMVQIRFVGGPNATVDELQRDWRAELGAPHICVGCQQDFSDWMKAGKT